MRAIEDDLQNRRPVWDALQMMLMDTSLRHELPRMAKTCAQSPYSLEELRTILLAEVLPACRSNFNPLATGVAPEWCGYNIDWLTQRIISKNRHGKSPVLLGRLSAILIWRRLKARIQRLRSPEPEPS